MKAIEFIEALEAYKKNINNLNNGCSINVNCPICNKEQLTISKNKKNDYLKIKCSCGVKLLKI